MTGDELRIDTPWRREPAELAAGLARWARATVGPAAEVHDVRAPGNGLSSETVLFDIADAAGRRGYVARLAPTPDVYPVFPEYDLGLQARCMDLVRAHTDVPAPVVAFGEQAPSWLGTPFIVMERVDGEAPPDIPPYVFGGWLHDATPDERRRMQRNAVSLLVRLHELSPATHDLAFLDRPAHGAPGVDQLLGRERWYYEWAREGVTYPLVERTLDWLERRRPPDSPPVLAWGDARIGNVLWRDFEPVAVLDWEMATVGPREVDLAWMVFLHAFFQDLAVRFAMPGLADFMRRDDMAAEYEDMSGHTVRDLEWYEVFAALRFAIVSIRTSTRGIAYGQAARPDDPDDLVMFRHLLEQMLDGSYWR
jgi:aminoglycoside phosphotransferase (APT) family kinase protein